MDQPSFVQRNRGVIIACVLYVLVSIGVCFNILPVIDEDFSDVVYFTVITLTTVGFGDIVPQTESGRLFMIFYVATGLILFSIIIGISSVRTMRFGLENVAQANSKRMNRFLRRFARSNKRKTESDGKGSLRALASFDGESDSDTEDGSGDGVGNRHRSAVRRLDALHRLTLVRVIRAAAPFFVYTIVGALVVHMTNAEWSASMDYTTSLYFTFTSGTTIGYGDIKPVDKAGKWFCVFYIPISVFVIWRTVNNVANIYIQAEVHSVNSAILSSEIGSNELGYMDETGDGRVTEPEFTKYMLVSMGKVDKETMDAIHAQFSSLDADGKGWLAATEMQERVRAATATSTSRALVPQRIATVQ